MLHESQRGQDRDGVVVNNSPRHSKTEDGRKEMEMAKSNALLLSSPFRHLQGEVLRTAP